MRPQVGNSFPLGTPDILRVISIRCKLPYNHLNTSWAVETEIISAVHSACFIQHASLTSYLVPHRATKTHQSPSIPYLKEGEHGREGDFRADNDRRTGQEHQFEPVDHLKWVEFKKFRSTIYEQFPQYPKPNQGISLDLETKDTWDAWQIWYDEFTNKYPGYAVAHLWPCGCEKVRYEDESEEE